MNCVTSFVLFLVYIKMNYKTCPNVVYWAMTPKEVKYTCSLGGPLPRPAVAPTTALLRVRTLPCRHDKFPLWLLQFVITHLQPILDVERKITNWRQSPGGRILCAIVMVSSLKMLEIFHSGQVSNSQLSRVNAISPKFRFTNYAF